MLFFLSLELVLYLIIIIMIINHELTPYINLNINDIIE